MCAATGALHHGDLGTRDLGRSVRDRRGCRVTLGPQSEERGIYSLHRLTAMKNNCHAARTQRDGRGEKDGGRQRVEMHGGWGGCEAYLSRLGRV